MTPETSPATAPADTTVQPSGKPIPWWRHALVYQVYPRSFADSDGDGTGDVNGIRSRLPYLRDLGVDAIWISPWYTSPLNDGGYDVADYRDIDPRFGTLADAEALFEAAHAHGIKVIVDLVPNHTSSEHPWFKAALAAAPGSAERARYIFKDGKGMDGSEPPTNWTAVFGGPAWERVADGQWYLHLFDPTQPDLNWENEEVRAEFDAIFRFWLDRGADGFRIDVAHGMVKDPAYPDIAEDPKLLENSRRLDHPHWDRDGIHEINRRWRAVLDSYDRDVMMVAEAWVDPTRLPLYLRLDEYHQSFNFDFLETPWDIDAVKKAIDHAVTKAREVGSTSTWTLSNHDVMRHASRYGLPKAAVWRDWPLSAPVDELAKQLDAELGLRRARAATLLLLALPGSTYIYQGEELGLPEVWDLPPEVLDDPTWENSGHKVKGRDGCRVPIPWTSSGPSFGFGDGKPWLPQPPRYGELSAEAQTGVPGSTLEMYREAIQLRRELLTADEDLEWVDTGDKHVLTFRRGSGLLCIVNFGAKPVAVPAGRVLLASQPKIEGELPGDTSAWVMPD
ncbi:MAG TPA: glycoside hydrolase family 13 protein [Ilumatobacter sp.]